MQIIGILHNRILTYSIFLNSSCYLHLRTNLKTTSMLKSHQVYGVAETYIFPHFLNWGRYPWSQNTILTKRRIKIAKPMLKGLCNNSLLLVHFLWYQWKRKWTLIINSRMLHKTDLISKVSQCHSHDARNNTFSAP